MNRAALPLRSALPYPGSRYAPALGRHFGDQTPERYKHLWQQAVLDKDPGTIHFSEHLNWPTRYYMGYEDTYHHSPDQSTYRELDRAYSTPADPYTPHQLGQTNPPFPDRFLAPVLD